MLVGFAEEEAAKTLILLDIVRCPPAQVSSRVGRIVKKVFYDHLARLIYAEAQSWKPVNVAQLQEYVDTKHQSHYLEGGMNEYIMPNWALYSRESAMYVDIEVYEDGKPQWNDPHRWSKVTMETKPIPLLLTEALSALSLFSRAGVRATADVWGAVNFVDSQGYTEGLVTEQANESHVHALYELWQRPMYSIDFNKIDIPLEQLKVEREAVYLAELGYEHYNDC